MIWTLRTTERLCHIRSMSRKLSDLSRVLNETCFKREISQTTQMRKLDNHFKRLRTPETAAVFFPVPKGTASRRILIYFNKSGRSFKLETFAMPPCEYHAFPPFFPRPCGVKHFLHTQRRACLRNWEDALSLRGARSSKSWWTCVRTRASHDLVIGKGQSVCWNTYAGV